jgi:hypothetical protein
MIANLHRRKVFERSFAPHETVFWDGQGIDGARVPGGVYVYFLEVAGKVHRGTVTVLR